MLEIVTTPDPLLIPLAVAAERLGDVDEDELAPVLAAASASVTAFIGRPIGVGSYKETLRIFTPVADAILSRYPVTSVTGLTVDGEQVDLLKDIEVDHGNGLVRRLTSKGRYQCWPVSTVVVDYQAGFSEIPADVQAAVMSICTDMWSARGRDPGLKQISIGSIGLQYFDSAAGDALKKVEPLLESYRQPMVG